MLYLDRETNNHRRNFALRGGSRRMSPYGYKQTFSRPKSTSALPPKADVLVAVTDFRV